jgi:hypothetical protein
MKGVETQTIVKWLDQASDDYHGRLSSHTGVCQSHE